MTRFKADYVKRTFTFSFKARTSRGLMQDKISWFIRLWSVDNPEVKGIGECGPLPGLSPEPLESMEVALAGMCEQIGNGALTDFASINKLVGNDRPSIVFGLETAFLDWANGGVRKIYDNEFLDGKPLPINGLIWMGDMDFMMSQVNDKVSQGYRCIKLKVGGIDFERECDILGYLRKRYYKEDLELRLDANGAFKPEDALYKLNELAKFRIQSIEQPIRPGNPAMEELCNMSPIPIALDEELIGIDETIEKEMLLQRIKPQFIILKPTLHGGLSGCAEWITLAEKNRINWWITSALESNVGLNAICQFTANYPVTLYQGLGTGMIYQNNITAPLVAGNGVIRLDPKGAWDLSDLEARH
jgi:o-succinylbenzoate synthase